jgi:hypothetical protein
MRHLCGRIWRPACLVAGATTSREETMSDRHSPVSELAGLLISLALITCPTALANTTLALRDGAQLAPPDIAVVDSDDQGTRLVIELPALAVETFDLDGEAFQSVLVEGGQLHGEPGHPALPAYVRYVAVPATAGVTLRIVATEEEALDGFHLLPMQDDETATFQLDQQLYSRDAFVGDEPVTIGSPTLLRDLRVVPVIFQPVRFNPATGELKVVHRVELELVYAGADLRNAKLRPSVPLTPSFDSLYRSVVVNYDPETTARSEGLAPHLGTYVLISRDNAQVTTLLQPLIQWRSRMGFNVVHATTAQTGTSNTSIRTWLQNAYNTWEYPPDFICLVGDASGSFSLPTFTETYSGYNGEGDHPYSQLTGDDLTPDAFVGRLSAEDMTTLERIVYKVNGYEQTPYMTETNWFTSACLTGDPSSSGVTCIHIMQWIKERLRQEGYTVVDTAFSPSYESKTLTSLNQGRSLFAYRGWLGMSGIETGDISALTNGRKLTYAVIPTCGTGSWASGTARSEAWIRGGAGTSTVTAGIGGIGTATTGTHTRYNNCFLSGVIHGIYDEHSYRLGENFTRGKVELVINYGALEPSMAGRFCYWNTLIADPATELWTGVPTSLIVTYPPIVAVGANYVTVTVHDEGAQPVEGAWVFLSKDEQIRVGGWTGADGSLEFPIDSSQPGTVNVVVTGHNLYPHQGSFQIAEAASFVGLNGYTIDDGLIPPEHGNSDGVANPGEDFGLGVALENFGGTTAENVQLHLSSSDVNLGWLTSADVSYGNIGGHEVAAAPQAVMLRLYPGTPPGHMLQFLLEITSDQGNWSSLLEVPVSGADMVFQSATLLQAGALLDPGESTEIQVTLKNNGAYAAQGPIAASLASDSYSVQLIDAAASYNSIAPGAVGTNTFDMFRVMSPANAIPGQLANLRIVLVCADGVRQTVPFTLQVGTADSNDPTGPDAYGYWCYDQTDTGYPDAPTYHWIDINPNSGGSGTSVGLNDYGTGGDDSRTLDLPFNFVYYGQPFDRVTICSNGWIAMDHTYVVSYRNWMLPSGEGPANMIAAFWDDLWQSGNNKVYYWNDTASHRFIVAWDMVRNDYGGGTESFEVILYDPLYYSTTTGDGIIDVMYEQIQDTDSEQMYSTAGIQNADHTTGINFCYYRQRPATAASYTSGLALRYTTGALGYEGLNDGPGDSQTRLLLRNDPNPWSGNTTFRFQLGQSQPVTLQVFDLDGRLVRRLFQGSLPAGQHALDWNGASDAGTPLPAGVYYYRLETPATADTRQLILIR